eukprot:scaffold40995_cov39-Tisochrysis_lutea.AAC.3
MGCGPLDELSLYLIHLWGSTSPSPPPLHSSPAVGDEPATPSQIPIGFTHEGEGRRGTERGRERPRGANEEKNRHSTAHPTAKETPVDRCRCTPMSQSINPAQREAHQRTR